MFRTVGLSWRLLRSVGAAAEQSGQRGFSSVAAAAGIGRAVAQAKAAAASAGGAGGGEAGLGLCVAVGCLMSSGLDKPTSKRGVSSAAADGSVPTSGFELEIDAGPFPTEKSIAATRERILEKRAFIIDMDGVVYHGNKLLPGVREFVSWLRQNDKRFLFLTNSSERSPVELQQKLQRMGVEAEEINFYTAAQATAKFLHSQRPRGTAYVIGEPGLLQALYLEGFTMNDVNPDYVVVGETRNYSFERISHAVHLILNGAKLIGTNHDVTDPSPTHPGEVIPAAGALIAPIESAAGVKPYYVGKPNPLMMRHALEVLQSKRIDTIIIGDRMDTDILAGLEASIDSCLVLSGVTQLEHLQQYAYMPRFILNGLIDLIDPTHRQSTGI
eukprot:jgi/Chlat1/8960/Chrsp94S08255